MGKVMGWLLAPALLWTGACGPGSLTKERAGKLLDPKVSGGQVRETVLFAAPPYALSNADSGDLRRDLITLGLLDQTAQGTAAISRKGYRILGSQEWIGGVAIPLAVRNFDAVTKIIEMRDGETANVWFSWHYSWLPVGELIAKSGDQSKRRIVDQYDDSPRFGHAIFKNNGVLWVVATVELGE
jgi:hypothetical protein